MLRMPDEEGVELYDVSYAKALAKTKIGEANMLFVPVDRIDKLISDLYQEGYLISQAHDQASLKALSQAFSEDRTLAIERRDLFGTLRFLKPSDALRLVADKASSAGLPVAFIGPQLERFVSEMYTTGIIIVHCNEEKERHWIESFHATKASNPKIRLRPQPAQPEGGAPK